MKTLINPIILICFLFTGTLFSQTADEIIENYLAKSGGIENWKNLSAIKMTAEAKNEGMVIPLTIYSTSEGKQAIIIEFMEQDITQFAYDGEVLWTTDSNMEPQKADEESTQNMKSSKNDFPNPFVDYKTKRYAVKLIGKEKVQGEEAFKILLIQEPIIIDGVEEQSISYYYFNTETGFPIMVETEINGGPMDEQLSTTIMKDYREVNGLYFPFSINENGQEIKIQKVILNPKIEADIFAFPEE